VTLWVKSRLAGRSLARQLYPPITVTKADVWRGSSGQQRLIAMRKNGEIFRRRTTVKYQTDLPMGTWYRSLHCKEHDPIGNLRCK
jgi:hypothetical protein